MSRWCGCHRKCRHLVPAAHYEALIRDPAPLVALEPVLRTLVDAADAFDSEGLEMDAACEVHGASAVSNAECRCVGERFSAVEFVQTLMIDIRRAIAQFEREPLSQDRRARWARKERAKRRTTSGRELTVVAL